MYIDFIVDVVHSLISLHLSCVYSVDEELFDDNLLLCKHYGIVIVITCSYIVQIIIR